MKAFCYASGQIEFTSSKVPDGGLVIAQGPDRSLRDFFSGVSRHAYDGETLLVPGVPEAPDQGAAMEALIRFLTWIRKSAPEGVTVVKPRGEKNCDRA